MSPPLYGADVPNESLFDPGAPFNLNELQTILTQGLGKHIKGVTNSYLYVGAWKTMFGWHKEDMDLYSINYLHAGKSKYWYGINMSSHNDFENLARRKF